MPPQYQEQIAALTVKKDDQKYVVSMSDELHVMYHDSAKEAASNLVDLLHYLHANLSKHSNYLVAQRVIECILYIKANIDDVAEKYGSSIRHPSNHLAIHLASYRSKEEATEELEDLSTALKKPLVIY